MAETGKKKIGAREVAFCGMAAALSVVVLCLAAVIPVLTYTAPLFISGILVPVRKSFGRGPAFLTYITVSLLVIILGADKEAAFFYVFFGHWPLLKETFDRIRPKALSLSAKVLFFTALTALMYTLLIRILGLSGIASENRALDLIFYVLLVAVMMMYDRLLTRLLSGRIPWNRMKIRKN